MLFRFILAWSCLISTWYHLGQLTVLYYYYLVPCLDTLGTVWYVSAAWRHLGHLVSLDWFFIKWLVKPVLHWTTWAAWDNFKHLQGASSCLELSNQKLDFLMQYPRLWAVHCYTYSSSFFRLQRALIIPVLHKTLGCGTFVKTLVPTQVGKEDSSSWEKWFFSEIAPGLI